jgi:hypothetical protein
MKYSVIIVLEEWRPDFPKFVLDLNELFIKRCEPFEIVIIANGAGGFLRNHLGNLKRCVENLKAFELNAKTTQAVCFKAGLKESTGKIIVGCESYQQITNDSLNRLLDALDDKVDIVTPWRQNRVDPRFNQIQSRVFNFIVKKIIKSDLHDLSCTVKVLRREVLEETQLYGNMYRFLPILAERKGFRSKEVKCDHYQERGKTGLYSLSEYLSRLIDILTLYFNTCFTRKPIRFFGAIGMLFTLVGILIGAYVFTQKLFLGYAIGERPILLLAILFTVLGIQAASVGLLGEIIVFTHGRHTKEYTIEKVIPQNAILEKINYSR